MPYIFFYGPELVKEKKRTLVKEFTESASKATGTDQQYFHVILQPSSGENVGVGGELVSDRKAKDKK